MSAAVQADGLDRTSERRQSATYALYSPAPESAPETGDEKEESTEGQEGVLGPKPVFSPMRVKANKNHKRLSQLRLTASSSARSLVLRVPPSPVPWPDVEADFFVTLVEPPRTVTALVKPRMADTIKELAPQLGMKPEDLQLHKLRVRQTGTGSSGDGMLLGNKAWEASVRSFWDSRKKRQEDAAIARLRQLMEMIETGMVESEERQTGVSATTEAVQELWEWNTRSAYRRHFVMLGTIQVLARVLHHKHLVAAHVPATSILCVYAMEERHATLLDQLDVLPALVSRLAEQQHRRNTALREHIHKTTRQASQRTLAVGRGDAGSADAEPPAPPKAPHEHIPVRGVGDVRERRCVVWLRWLLLCLFCLFFFWVTLTVEVWHVLCMWGNQAIVMHLDYVAAAFINALASHRSGRAVVYGSGVHGVRLLEMLVGSRELATAG